ncbi:MAG TPA: hypothetical protein VF974_01490, partial [Patescibacteria group bacterium]
FDRHCDLASEFSCEQLTTPSAWCAIHPRTTISFGNLVRGFLLGNNKRSPHLRDDLLAQHREQ